MFAVSRSDEGAALPWRQWGRLHGGGGGGGGGRLRDSGCFKRRVYNQLHRKQTSPETVAGGSNLESAISPSHCDFSAYKGIYFRTDGNVIIGIGEG